jgi:hypothetical protein
MKAYEGVEFVTSALDGGEWSASCLGLFTPLYPLERHWNVGPRGGLDSTE